MEIIMPQLKTATEHQRASLLASLAGRAYLDEDDQKNVEKQIGLQRTKSKYISGEDDSSEAWIFYTKDNSIVVACRGTEPTEFKDVLADLDLYPLKHPVAGRVHRGFHSYANRIYPKVLEEIKKGRKKDQDVYVCGHSLGGAMAVIIAEQLISDGIPVKELSTYGQPRVGTPAYCAYLDTCGIGDYKRYVNNNDVVPKVPPTFLMFRHTGDLKYINYFGKIRKCTTWQRTKDQFRGWTKALSKFEFFDFVRDHGMPYYVKYTSEIVKNDK